MPLNSIQGMENGGMMAVKEKEKGVELRVGNALDKLKEHQKDWEEAESLREFLRFVRGEDIADSLKESVRRERGKL